MDMLVAKDGIFYVCMPMDGFFICGHCMQRSIKPKNAKCRCGAIVAEVRCHCGRIPERRLDRSAGRINKTSVPEFPDN